MVGSVTLLEFIEARLAEDQAAAEAAMAGPGWYGASHSGQWEQDDASMPGAVHDTIGGPIVFDEGAPNEAQAVHIARFDPARVLREVAAKRRLLAYLTALEEKALDNNWWNLDTYEPFQLLATAWSEHPDYDPTWSPT